MPTDINGVTKCFYLPPDLAKSLHAEATDEDRSDSQQLTRILRERYEARSDDAVGPV